ncbi:MAG: hypothetical protein R3F60_16275 [bacterium]
MNTSKIKHFCLLSALLGAPLAGCDEDEAAGQGTWGLSIYGEAFIEEGIPASAFADGWAVRFDHFYVVVSGLKAPGATFEGAYVFDLAQPSGGAGHPITEAMVAAGYHPTLGYAIRPVSAATPANVDAAVAEALVAGGFSMQIEGRRRGAPRRAGSPGASPPPPPTRPARPTSTSPTAAASRASSPFTPTTCSTTTWTAPSPTWPST